MYDRQIPERLAPKREFWIGMINGCLIVGAIAVLIWLL